jgi:peptide/nickel transport system permease protein
VTSQGIELYSNSRWASLVSRFGTIARYLYADKLVLAAVVFVLALMFTAIAAEYTVPYSPTKQNLLLRNTGPSLIDSQGGFPHILGTDQLGRDELSRLIFGARVSLTVGIAAVAFSGTFGVVLGLLAGFYRGKVDDIIMRFVDVVMGFPSLLLALAVLYAAGAGFINLVLVLAATRWMLYARVTRGMTFTLRETMFVDAARVAGASDRRILFRHILPNLLSPILVLGTLEIARAILAEAALSFLGLGIQPPESSWGLMLSQGREYMTTAWWLVTVPGFVILLTTLSCNLIASWARGVTDPVQRWRWLGTRPAQK